MCLYPITIKNKRFLPNKKNGWRPPVCPDERLLYVDCDCGYCYECRKKNARQWRIRMSEELKQNPHAVFFTGTFAPKRIEYLCGRYGLDEEDVNAIATKEMRLFLERLRKANGGRSVKHWVVTERGHDNTKRIHVHGIYFHEDKKVLLKLLRENWIAGYKYNGQYVNEKTINYIVKYLTKTDLDNPNFKGKVLASPGLGNRYVKSLDAQMVKYFPRTETRQTRDWYIFRDGTKASLPRYYREKLFTEDERQLLWIEKQEEGFSYVMGEKIDTNTEEGKKQYKELKDYYKNYCIQVHKDNPDDWELKRMTLRQRRAARKCLEFQKQMQKRQEINEIRERMGIFKYKKRKLEQRLQREEEFSEYEYLYGKCPF